MVRSMTTATRQLTGLDALRLSAGVDDQRTTHARNLGLVRNVSPDALPRLGDDVSTPATSYMIMR